MSERIQLEREAHLVKEVRLRCPNKGTRLRFAFIELGHPAKAKTEHKDINTRALLADALTFEGALFVFER